jgi:hypothetical protein
VKHRIHPPSWCKGATGQDPNVWSAGGPLDVEQSSTKKQRGGRVKVNSLWVRSCGLASGITVVIRSAKRGRLRSTPSGDRAPRDPGSTPALALQPAHTDE